MGDAPGAAVLSLLIPGLLAPLLLLPKLALRWWPGDPAKRAGWPALALLSLLESEAPFASMLLSFPILATVVMLAPPLAESREFRLGVLLAVLLLVNVSLDALFLWKLTRNRRLAAVLGAFFGLLASGIFVVAWNGFAWWLLRS